MTRTFVGTTIFLMLLFAGPALAQSVTVGSVSVECGQSAQVSVSIESTSGLLAVQFDIAYDAALLQVSNVQTGSVTSGFSIASNISGGVIKIAMASGSPAPPGGGVIATFAVRVGSGASPGTSTLAISNVLVNDVTKVGHDGTVTIGCLQPPSAPTYVSPANGATNVAAPVRLDWNASAGASGYRVYFGTGTMAFIKATTSTSADVETATGTTYAWAVEAFNDAGSSGQGPTWTFTTSGPFCGTPGTPQLIAPTAAASTTAYDVSWAAVTDATEYALEESTNAAFTTSTSTTTAGLKLSFTKTVTAATNYYYRVRGRNTASGCSVNGPFSATATVKVSPKPPIPVGGAVLPAVGSTPGVGGAMFRTSIQLYNETGGTIRGRIVYHAGGTSGSENDPFLPYVLTPGETISYLDLLPAMGITSGLGSVDLVPDSGNALPLFVTRVYNDGGASGTSGMTLDTLRMDDALVAGQHGVIIAPMDPLRMRMNIGIRSLGDGATVTVTMRNNKGVTVTTKHLVYSPTYFTQSAAEVLLGVPLAADATLTFAMESGSAFIYGSSTDNTTQDTNVQIARPVA